MKTKEQILSEYHFWVEDKESFLPIEEVKQVMDEWGKQTVLCLFEEMSSMFDKRERELWDKIEPKLKQVFKYKLYGEIPENSTVIDKWYEQYQEKLKSNGCH